MFFRLWGANVSLGRFMNLMWMHCMNEGNPLIEALEDFLEDLYLSGEVPQSFVSIWKEALQICPRGYLDHIDTRTWCAYCGDISADICYSCNTWFDRRRSEEDYCSVVATDLCVSCHQEAKNDCLP